MLGYRGIGGDIDGMRNPTLRALTGETVRITIVNGELMVHDIALEKAQVKSAQILDEGATASITFKAKASDTYYCTVPGHRLAGMEGRLDVSDPRPPSEGLQPEANGAPLNLGFESGTLENWTARRRVHCVKGGAIAGGRRRQSAQCAASRALLGQQRRKGNARKGTLTSKPFRVTQPYASFLVSGGAFASTRVDVVLAADKKVLYSISGTNHACCGPRSSS